MIDLLQKKDETIKELHEKLEWSKDEKIKELQQQLEEQKKKSDSGMKKKDLTIDPPEFKPVTIFHVNNQPASQ